MTYEGMVEKGKGTGKKLGYPTVNIRLTDPEPSGIYAAIVRVEGKAYPAAGFADQARALLEAHILDFEGDLYGKTVTIELRHKIRDRALFTEAKALEAAIAADVSTIRTWFEKNHYDANGGNKGNE